MTIQTLGGPLRRLIENSHIRDLEIAALLAPHLTTPEALEHSRVSTACRQVFGIDGPTIDGWIQGYDLDEDIQDDDERWQLRDTVGCLQHLSDGELLEVFQAQGWDLRDETDRPLRTIRVIAVPLQMAILGEGGAKLPGAGQDVSTWAEGLEVEAAKFQRDHRRR